MSCRLLAGCLLLIMVAGCAATPPVPPSEMTLSAPAETTLRQAVELLVEQGYVIRHADLALGRAEASLARWPEYRVTLQVIEQGENASLIRVMAQRGGKPLPAYLLDPWLASLQAKMGLAH
ncbi:hypothetical protein LG290_14245 [Halomonas sediminis]